MKTRTILVVLAIAVIIQQAHTQTFEWARQLGGTSINHAFGNSIAIDASGNVYTTGAFNETVDFDPGGGAFNLTAAGDADVFISKLDAAGNFVWAKQMRSGGSGIFDSGSGNSIALDASANIYTTGYFHGTVDFDPGAGTFNLTSAGDADVFISKLDAAGNFIWAKQLGGTSWDNGFSIALDASGNVYTLGDFSNTVDFDPGAGSFNLTSVGASDMFISKLDAAGNFIWAKQLGGTNSVAPRSISLDASGNIYTTGGFRGTADFDPGSGTFNLTSGGNTDIFISKLDAVGNFVWAKQLLGGSTNEVGNSIAVDASGNVYTTGLFEGTVDFDPGIGTFNLTSGSNIDVFISKLDASGNFVWAKQLGGTDWNDGSSIAIDASGNVYTTGAFGGTVDFDPGVNTVNLTSGGGSDIFISKLDASGNFVGAIQLGGFYADYGRFITLDGSGNLYATGSFQSTADFDPGVGTYYLYSSGGNDVFVYKMQMSEIGVAENSFGNQFSVYPNPTSGKLHLVFSENITKTNITVKTYLGQEIFKKSYTATNNIDLTLDGLAGIYFVEIVQNEQRAVIKVVKN